MRIEGILTVGELQWILDRLAEATFKDGQETAGWYAKEVKRNYQLNCRDDQELGDRLRGALLRHPLFQAIAQPKKIHTILVSRYQAGMFYGPHVDNAIMGGEWRADVSFTLFLASPQDYQGGELVLDLPDGEQRYKLAAGEAVVYPSNTLHWVEEVTDGVRLAAVGWLQTWVRDEGDREILFELDTVRRSIFAKEGKTLEFDLLSKTYSNLLRKWAE